ncbi:MAG: VTT domain-containing protein [Chloroflexota bacterium]
MKRYLGVVFALLVIFTLLFVLVDDVLQIEFLQDPSSAFGVASISTAFIGIGLLIADVFIPVPSSIVMIAHGALFGVVLGTILSTIGGLGASLVGFWMGQRSDTLLSKFVPPDEMTRANALLDKYGTVAIILTRPIPIVAETVAIMAGSSSMKWQTMAIASLAGVVPSALLYAVTGATVMRLDNFVLTIGSVLLIAIIFGVIERTLLTRLNRLSSEIQ